MAQTTNQWRMGKNCRKTTNTTVTRQLRSISCTRTPLKNSRKKCRHDQVNDPDVRYSYSIWVCCLFPCHHQFLIDCRHINLLKFNKIKTANNFHKKKKIYCRYATLKDESFNTNTKISRFDSYRQRIRTTISRDDEDYQSSSPLPCVFSNSPYKIIELDP